MVSWEPREEPRAPGGPRWWIGRLTPGCSSGHDRRVLASACVGLPAQNGVCLRFLPLALPPLLLPPQLWLALPLRNKILREKRVTRSAACPVAPEHRLPPRPMWPPRLSPRDASTLSSLPGELRVHQQEPSPGGLRASQVPWAEAGRVGTQAGLSSGRKRGMGLAPRPRRLGCAHATTPCLKSR